MNTPIRIAMWSGPRNISTALMRAWENRTDTFVTDEPFYAHYLAHTRMVHPGLEDIIKSQPTDWTEVVAECTTVTEPNCSVHYQKHMTHHVLSHIELDFLAALTNVFLIRSPEHVVASYSKARPDLTAADVGFEQQARIFNYVCEQLEQTPLVISSADLLNNPQAAMILLCDHCGVPFDENMLKWPAGKRATDGVWAPYWYENVEKSTGFAAPPKEREITLNAQQQSIADSCQPFYELMAKHAAKF